MVSQRRCPSTVNERWVGGILGAAAEVQYGDAIAQDEILSFVSHTGRVARERRQGGRVDAAAAVAGVGVVDYHDVVAGGT